MLALDSPRSTTASPAAYAQLSSYSSTSDSDAIAFLNALGYSSEGEFSTRYSAPILATDSLFGVKICEHF